MTSSTLITIGYVVKLMTSLHELRNVIVAFPVSQCMSMISDGKAIQWRPVASRHTDPMRYSRRDVQLEQQLLRMVFGRHRVWTAPAHRSITDFPAVVQYACAFLSTYARLPIILYLNYSSRACCIDGALLPLPNTEKRALWSS